MGAIATTEDAILDQVEQTLGAAVRVRETLPGGWTLDTLQRALQAAPGVYVAFQGLAGGRGQGYHDGRFTLYAVTNGAAERDRRRGNPRIIGAYDIIERLLPPLSVLTISGIGTLQVTGVDNLFRDAMFDLGGTVYGVQLTLPNMPFEYRADLDALADFILFHGEAHNPGGIEGGEAPLITGEQTLHSEE